MSEDIKIIAAVKFNKGEAYVLDRMPDFKYQEEGDYLYAYDSGFVKVYGYERPYSRFYAFGGSKFDIPMLSGGVKHAYGQWWDKGQSYMAEKLGVELCHITFRTVEQLKKCYVYTGASIDKKALEKMRAEYDGPVYAYYDYEKIIKYDDFRHEAFNKQFELEQKSKAILREARKWKSLYEKERKYG